MKIIFYGDSNTYGFDPAYFSGGRYPENLIWTSLLADSLGREWEVINEGMNGRRIPFPGQYDYVSRLLESLSEEDYFAVMLGPNDILMSEDSDADRPARNMDSFLAWLTERLDPRHVIVIAPVCAGDLNAYDPVYRHFYDESVRMNKRFAALAEMYRCHFADASGWNIETAYDMLHFSEGGHRTFAEQLLLWLRQENLPGI